MQQKLYKFKGDTLDEAYRTMRAALGGDAVVLSTNEVVEGGVLGFLGQKKVELTAAAPEATSPRPAPQGKPKAAPSKTARTPSPVERKYLASAPVASDERVSETIAHFQKLVKEAKDRIARATGPPPTRTALNAVSPTPLSKRDETPGRPAPAGQTDDPIEEMRHGVREVQDTLRVLMAEITGTGPHKEFSEHYRMLVDQGISRRTAASLIAKAVKGGDRGALRDPRVFRERLKFQVRRLVKTTGGIKLVPGIRRTVALVGATGVGKTTNLAKLAAEFAVRERVSVGLVTCDTYRIAAPEQLRVYANIIGLPMKVVNEPQEMASAMEEFRKHDLVLIDTAGGSQFNVEQIEELKDLLAPARPDEVLLLLSCNTQLHELHNAVANFRRLDPTSLFFTKLDETRQYGALFSAYVESDLPLSYFSVGQDVPNDIELANPGKVANLVVEGGESRDRSSPKSA
jgi:flagellar biosynthesis protein FlhF